MFLVPTGESWLSPSVKIICDCLLRASMCKQGEELQLEAAGPGCSEALSECGSSTWPFRLLKICEWPVSEMPEEFL